MTLHNPTGGKVAFKVGRRGRGRGAGEETARADSGVPPLPLPPLPFDLGCLRPAPRPHSRTPSLRPHPHSPPKVKTTSPKKYCVRPSSGIVEAGATKEVQVIMQAQRDPPPSLADCRDKFLVQAVRVGGEATEVTPDMFDAARARDIRQTKLRVVLVAPAKPPSPVPEGVEDSLEASPGGVGGGRGGGAGLAGTAGGARLEDVARERDRLRDQLAKSEREKVKKGNGGRDTRGWGGRVGGGVGVGGALHDSRSHTHTPSLPLPSALPSPPSLPKARLDALARGRASTASGPGFGPLAILLVALLAFVVGQALASRVGSALAGLGLGGKNGWAAKLVGGGVGGKGLGAHLEGLAKKAKAWAAAAAKK